MITACYTLIVTMLDRNRDVLIARNVTRIDDVEDYREDDAGAINPKSDPPKQLLVKLLLEILQHDESDG